MPDIFEVPWKPAGRDQDYVYSDSFIAACEAWDQRFGSTCHPGKPLAVDRDRQSRIVMPALDLHEQNSAAASGDQIDFADRRPQPPCDDAPAMEAEPPGRNCFGAPSTSFGVGAVQCGSLSAIARA